LQGFNPLFPGKVKTILLVLEDPVAIRTLSRVKGDGRHTKVFTLSSDEAVQYLHGEGRFSERTCFPLPHAILCDADSFPGIADSCKAVQLSPRLFLLTDPSETETIIRMLARALR